MGQSTKTAWPQAAGEGITNTAWPIGQGGNTEWPRSAQGSDVAYPPPAAVTLAARYLLGGGEIWGDIDAVSQHLPRNADGHYEDGNGSLLIVEEGFTEGAPLPRYVPWPSTQDGVIINQPATTRTGGLDNLDDDNHAIIASTGNSVAVFFDIDIVVSPGGVRNWVAATASGKWRFIVHTTSILTVQVLIISSADSTVLTLSCGQNYQVGDRAQLYVSLDYDAGSGDLDVYMKAWGRSVNTDSGTVGSVPADELAGAYYVGRGTGTGNSLDARISIRQAAAWNNAGPSAAEADAIRALIVADTPIDEATPTATTWMRGITPGVYKGGAPDELLLLVDVSDRATPYIEDVDNPAPVLLPALRRADFADDYLRSLAAAPQLPEEGAIILAIEAEGGVVSPSGATIYNWGYTYDAGEDEAGGARLALVTSTTTDRGRGVRGQCTLDAALTGLVPDQTDIAVGSPTWFLVARWTSSALAVTSCQNGAVLTNVVAVYQSDINGALTDIITWANGFEGRVAVAILNENPDSTLIAAAMSSLYSPRNWGASRGTLWYSPAFGIEGGRPITASDIYAFPGSVIGTSDILYEVVAGTNPLRAYPYLSWPGFERVSHSDEDGNGYGDFIQQASPIPMDGRTVFLAYRHADAGPVPVILDSATLSMRVNGGYTAGTPGARFFDFPGAGAIALTGLHPWGDGIIILQLSFVDDGSDGEVNFRAKDSLGATFEGGDLCTGALDSATSRWNFLCDGSRRDWGVEGEGYGWVVDGNVPDTYLDDMPTTDDFQVIQDYVRDRHAAGDTLLFETVADRIADPIGNVALSDDTISGGFGSEVVQLGTPSAGTALKAYPPYSVAQYPVRFLTQETAGTSGGQAIAAGSTWTVPDVIVALWYGAFVAIDGSVGVMLDGIGTDSTQRGFWLGFNSATEIQFTIRRPTGSGSGNTHTVSDASAYGPRLYWGVSDDTGTLPSTEDNRVGVDDMLVDGDYTPSGIQHGAGGSDTPITMGARSAPLGLTDSLTYRNARGIVLGRLLTADEWAAARRGDFSWAEGDADLLFDSAALAVAGTSVSDPTLHLLDTTNVLTTGSVPPVAARNKLVGQ